MKIPVKLCMHMKAKCVLEGLVPPSTANCVWSRLKPCWGWLWRCSHMANLHLLQTILCQSGSVQLWEGGEVREVLGREEPHRFASLLLSVLLSHRHCVCERGAGSDKPCHPQPQQCLLHVWQAKGTQAAAPCPWKWRGAPSTKPAQNILERRTLGNFIYSCWFVQIVWYLYRQFPILHIWINIPVFMKAPIENVILHA